MGVIVVTGIPGVGKTTVMKQATEGLDIEFVTFGSVMIDIAKEMGLVKDRDEMRKLTLEQQKDLQIHSAERSR
jgi:adenylate kinase